MKLKLKKSHKLGLVGLVTALIASTIVYNQLSDRQQLEIQSLFSSSAKRWLHKQYVEDFGNYLENGKAVEIAMRYSEIEMEEVVNHKIREGYLRPKSDCVWDYDYWGKNYGNSHVCDGINYAYIHYAMKFFKNNSTKMQKALKLTFKDSMLFYYHGYNGRNENNYYYNFKNEYQAYAESAIRDKKHECEQKETRLEEQRCLLYELVSKLHPFRNKFDDLFYINEELILEDLIANAKTLDIQQAAKIYLIDLVIYRYKDYNKQKYWNMLQELSDQSYYPAQILLAYYLYNDHNNDKALEIYNKSKLNNNKITIDNLSDTIGRTLEADIYWRKYARSKYIDKDKDKSKQWLQKYLIACRVNNLEDIVSLPTFHGYQQPNSCLYHIASDYQDEKKYGKAKEIYDKIESFHANNIIALFQLGVIYYNGLGLRQDLEKAKSYFGRACDLNDQSSCDLFREVNEKIRY